MSGVPAISRIDRRPPYTFHHKDGPLDDIGSAKLWPEAVEPTRIVEYKGFKLRRTNANPGYFWTVAASDVPKEISGSFTKIELLKTTIDDYLRIKEERNL